MDILRPKQLETHDGESLVGWAVDQLSLARSILDNPGGGLLFGTQTIGQVKSALRERDPARWQAVVGLLDTAEDSAVHRDFGNAARLIGQALDTLKTS